jgi:predicted RNase H-like HicB family nuclease
MVEKVKIEIERDPKTGLYIGYIPGWPGAHAQAETLDELAANLEEVIALLVLDAVEDYVSRHHSSETGVK